MIKKLIDFVFGKVHSTERTRRVKPLAFTNSNYRPSSFSLKIDSFMLGLDEKQKKRG
jgi:hypothetical protein